MRHRSSQYIFNSVPTAKLRRNRFDLSHRLLTSMTPGKLYPIMCEEVIPGDTFKIKENHVIRLTSQYMRPVMDNLFMDVYYFYVPSRILYDDFQKVFGNPSSSAYVNNELSEIPTVPSSGNGKVHVTSKSVADYLGLPVGDIPDGISLLPFRAFAKIYNEWFRNENTVNETYVHTGEAVSSEALNSNAWSATNYTGMLPNVMKKKDYFTSCLPAPQKGAPVSLPIGGTAPIVGTFDTSGIPVGFDNTPAPWASQPTVFGLLNGVPSSITGKYVIGANGGKMSYHDDESSLSTMPLYLSLTSRSTFKQVTGTADLSQATAVNVNDMRLAFALQKMQEEDARGGTRYREYILSHFGVSNGDIEMQIPEFLGGRRTPLGVQQVAQTTSRTSDTDPDGLGSLGAFSHSVGGSRITKSFTEYGYVIGVACIRQMHTYQQGVARHWSRHVRNDFYDPKFANLGEQPVYTSQLYATGQLELKGDVFGYQEAWAEYRNSPNRVSGEMRTAASHTLDVYHFADNYSSKPVLNQQFTDETPAFFGRTIAVDPTIEDAFAVDMWFDFQAYREMPLYSVPGLIDHH